MEDVESQATSLINYSFFPPKELGTLWYRVWLTTLNVMTSLLAHSILTWREE